MQSALANLENLEKEYGIHMSNPHKPNNLKSLIIQSKIKLYENPEEHFQSTVDSIIDIYNVFKMEDANFEAIVRVNRILELIYYSRNACIAIKRIQEVSDHSHDFRDNFDSSLFRFKAIDESDNTRYQNFLLYILGIFTKNAIIDTIMRYIKRYILLKGTTLMLISALVHCRKLFTIQ